MFGLSGGEMIVILLAFLILFGSKKIPEFAQALGKGMKEFKKKNNRKRPLQKPNLLQPKKKKHKHLSINLTGDHE
jgi:TatA/E family protein of Tat protein translocase